MDIEGKEQVDIYLICPTVPEFNSSEHWSSRGMRHRLQKKLVAKRWILDKPQVALPCKVVLTRIATRKLDEHDNLPGSLKWIADAVADCILPGQKAGQADASPLIKWGFRQEFGKIRAVRIQIFSMTSSE